MRILCRISPSVVVWQPLKVVGYKSLVVALLCCANVFAQQGNVLKAVRVEKPPVIDGVLDDQEWKDIPSLEGLVDKFSGSSSPVGGKFWLGYDSKFVYFAARLDDPDPKKIVATEYRVNEPLDGNDSVALLLDPFGTLQEANVFTMNASGGTSIQIAGGRAAKREWLGEILCKGRITATGWEVEARIPWAIMRLPGKGSHEVRFNVERFSPRLNRTFAWTYTQGNSTQNTGRWQTPELPDIAGKTIKFLPYTFLGADRQVGLISNSGVDIRTQVTDKIDFVGSVNPDFRNVENSILNLGFSYFERLANETRPFFLEGKDYFGSSFDEPVFATQRINRFDLGEKIYGKINDSTDLGFLNTTSYGTQDATVVKVKHTFQPREFIEGIVVNDLEKGADNQTSFLQYQKPQGDWTFFGQHSATIDQQVGTGHRINVGEFYSHNGLNADVEYIDVSPNYLPRLGFAPRTGYQGVTGNWESNRPHERGPFIDHDWGMFGTYTRDTANGGWYSREVGAFGSTTLRKIPLQISSTFDYSRFRGHDDLTFDYNFGYPRGNTYDNIQWDQTIGRLEGKAYHAESLTLSKRAFSRLQSNLQIAKLTLGEDVQNQLIGSSQYDLGRDRYVSGRVVRQGRDTNVYFSYQRSGAEGIEYYFILGDPNALKTRSSLVLKVVMPFETRR